jgi:hypothetical protein
LKTAPLKLLLLDNVAGVLVRYDDRRACERYEITNRQEFNATFDCDTAERLRLGVQAVAKQEQA